MNDLVGSFEHYTAWQPGALEYFFEFSELATNGEMRCFRCIAAKVSDDPTPAIVVQAWSPFADDAQYHAYKRAAYFLTFGVLPKPGTFEEETELLPRMTMYEDDMEIVRVVGDE